MEQHRPTGTDNTISPLNNYKEYITVNGDTLTIDFENLRIADREALDGLKIGCKVTASGFISGTKEYKFEAVDFDDRLLEYNLTVARDIENAAINADKSSVSMVVTPTLGGAADGFNNFTYTWQYKKGNGRMGKYQP